MNATLASLVVSAREALASLGEVHGCTTGGAPRFELFHAANSICSQKVRAVLTHHRLAYVSHPVDLFAGQTYLPAYVRLRMVGCDRLGGALATHHGGSTATSAGGCDGAVVPTLVDWETAEVVVDSQRICLHLDAQAPASAKLCPARSAEQVLRELDIVDHLPNYQMLMAGRPGGEGSESAFSRKKVAWCDRYLLEHAADAVLVSAYAAKRAKELSAATGLFSADAMAAAANHAHRALGSLDRELERRNDEWLLGNGVTMADLFWGVQLLRLDNLGLASLWNGGKLPQVERFAAATQALPAIRVAVTEWPGALF